MNEKIKVIEGGVTAAKGFMAASTAAGIKYKNRQDMARSTVSSLVKVQEPLPQTW